MKFLRIFVERGERCGVVNVEVEIKGKEVFIWGSLLDWSAIRMGCYQ